MQNLRSWITAFFTAVLLNLLFFSLMPLMMDKDAAAPDKGPDFKTVNVVRIRQKERPPEKKEEKKIKEEKKTRTEKTETIHQNVKKEKFSPAAGLPFEINQKLPPVPGIPGFSMENITIAPPAMKDVYAASELDKGLTPLAHVPPVYPVRARQKGIEGWVRVKFMVNSQGNVEHPEVIEADPEEVFDSSVLNAVAQWRFSPGTIEGVAVNTYVETTVRFKLEK